MARPSFKPTDEQRRMVEMFAAYGIPVEQMVHLITNQAGKPISENTLRKHFRDELDTGTVKANAKIASRLYQKAIDGDTTAIIFWLKTRARWHTSQHVEMSGPDNSPIVIVKSYSELAETDNTAK